VAKILVIDDDAEFREFARRLLEKAGYQVIEARNGAVGVEAYRRSPVDLVITDIIMPVKEGIATILELRQIDPEVKVVAISGGGQVKNLAFLNVAEQRGAARVLAKPIRAAELLQVVAELMTPPD
jgi:CheY-like chemotaxis protein